ncbi:MAG: DUF2063 domain-containing protein, partial [Candidatus Competibacter sp.]|nr:DUF2063 domain-containing protein [Candidatus Competibacter sp.]
AAHQGHGDLTQVDPFVPESALIVRVGLDVQVLALPPGGDTLVASLVDGLPLGQAAALALVAREDFDLTAHLALLLRAGALTALTLPVETSP